MKKVAIILVTYNNAEATYACLDSLEKMQVKNLVCHIIIVDNASEESFSLSENKRTIPVEVIRNEQNLGFTGGNNAGIHRALQQDIDYILLLNNDTTVDSHLLQELIAASDADTKRGVVVPKIYYTKGSEYHKDRYKKDDVGHVLWYAGGSIDWTTVTGKHRGVDEVDHGQYDKNGETTFASGCCMLIKREVFETVGLFDNRYFLYYEDADLSERVIKKGYTIFYAHKAVIRHENAGSSGGSGSDLQDYYVSRNRLLFGFLYSPLRLKLALVRESMRLLLCGRTWQKKGIIDFFLGRFGKGSYAEIV